MNSLLDYTESLTEIYLRECEQDHYKKYGQFFTPKATSNFMVRQFKNITNRDSIRILDPGAGVGIFESAFCDFLSNQKKKPRISFDLFEIDNNLIILLNKTVKACKDLMTAKGFEISINIYNEDFIMSKGHLFNSVEDANQSNDGYDIVIANPPYFKIKKSSPQATKMIRIIRGQPNIYALFMALSAKLLKIGGQITVLTPRSYCSGAYFKLFRKWFFKSMKPTKIHIFKSRKEIFRKYNVLQEMIILTAIKKANPPKEVQISVSVGETYRGNGITKGRSAYNKVLIKDKDHILRIPTSPLDEKVSDEFDKFHFTLETLGLKISTGPIVPFRTKDYLIDDIQDQTDYAPLLWMQNIIDGKVVWPIPLKNKMIAIKTKEKIKKFLVPQNNYVLVKRLSSKEGKRRIVAGVLFKKAIDYDFIGIENHMNYIYSPYGHFSDDETYGIAALLNSKLFNRYFQMINGSTQVNASEINNIPFPSIDKIKEIGKVVKTIGIEKNAEVDSLIEDKLNIKKTIRKELSWT